MDTTSVFNKSDVWVLRAGLSWVIGVLIALGSCGVPLNSEHRFILAMAVIFGVSMAWSQKAPKWPRRITFLVLLVLICLGTALAAYAKNINTTVLALLVSLLLLAIATLGGAWIGREVEHPWHLCAVAIVSAIADTYSVFAPTGPTASIVKQPALLSLVAVSWPFIQDGAISLLPVLGIGDLTFCSLYIAATERHAMRMSWTISGLTLGALLATMLVIWLQRPLPVLPFLGAGVVIAQPQSRCRRL